MTTSNNNLSRKMIFFLLDEIGLDHSSIELGLKLSKRKIPLSQYYYGVMEC